MLWGPDRAAQGTSREIVTYQIGIQSIFAQSNERCCQELVPFFREIFRVPNVHMNSTFPAELNKQHLPLRHMQSNDEGKKRQSLDVLCNAGCLSIVYPDDNAPSRCHVCLSGAVSHSDSSHNAQCCRLASSVLFEMRFSVGRHTRLEADVLGLVRRVATKER